MKILNKIVNIMYPKTCIICRCISKSNDNFGVCKDCFKKLKLIHEPMCLKCGKPLENDEDELCSICKRYKRYFTKGQALFEYNDAMKKSIYRFKDGGCYSYGSIYADMMYRYLSDFYNRYSFDIIIGVPISRNKKDKRGYNQSDVLAKELSRKLNVRCSIGDICKIKENRAQKKLNFKDRQLNVKNTFRIEKNIFKNKKVLIVDDVITTGSTINELARVLHLAGSKEIYFTTVCTGRD